MTFLWFVFVSQFGWTRHAWHGLLLSMMLISVGLGVTLRASVADWNKEGILSLLVIILAVAMMVRFDRVEMRLLLDDKTIDKWEVSRSYRHEGIALLGLPHAAIFSLDDQRDTVEFFKEKIRKEDRIYYINLFFVSEIATLADKVFYPINRYFNNNCQNPEGGKTYLIVGPYQQGRWSFTPDNYAQNRVATLCDNTIFTNESYTICGLKECISSG